MSETTQTEVTKLKNETDQILKDVESINLRKRQLIAAMMQHRNPAEFDCDGYTHLRRELINIAKKLDKSRKQWSKLEIAVQQREEKGDQSEELCDLILERISVCDLVLNNPVLIEDDSLHNLWLIVMITRFEFRTLFGVSSLEHIGFFVDRQMTAIVHSYSQWIDYPHSNQVSRDYFSEGILAAVVSNDGRYLFTGNRRRTIAVWDLTDEEGNRRLDEWDAHNCRVIGLAYYAPYLVSIGGCKDKLIKLWNAFTFELIRIMEGHTGGVTSVDFDNNGRHIISGSSDNSIRVWSLENGRCINVLSGHTATVRSLKWFSVDVIISGSNDSTLKVWNPNDGMVTRNVDSHVRGTVIPRSRFDESRGRVTAVSVNCDGSSVFCCCIHMSSVVYAWPSFEILSELDMSSYHGCFHPSNPDWLAVSGYYEWSGFIGDKPDYDVRLYDTRTQEFIRYFFGHSQTITDLCFTPDGSRLVSVSSDETVRVWDLSERT